MTLHKIPKFVVITICAIASNFSFAHQAFACQNVFVFPEFYWQTNIVQHVLAAKTRVLKTERVGHSHRSYSVPTRNGMAVIRFESETNDIAFEQFSSYMFRTLGLNSPYVQVEPLPIELGLVIRNKLVENGADDELKEQLFADPTPKVSISAFFGYPYVMADVFIPIYIKLFASDFYLENQEALAAKDSQLREQMWHFLPPEAQQNIADLWAGYVVMGISDPHNGNWLIDPQRLDVVGIDLAMRTTIFERGMSKLPWFALCSPMGPAGFSAEHFQDLKEAISPGMKQALMSLDRHKIQKVAHGLKFAINDTQIQGMIDRARGLLE